MSSLITSDGRNLAQFLQDLTANATLVAAENDCCGIPGCEHEEPGLAHSVVLVDASVTGRGVAGQRVEAFVLEEYNASVKLRFKDGIDAYFSDEIIIDELGPATSEQYTLFGVDEPEAPPTPNYQTGTYVASTHDGLYLVEVDRIGDKYYIHAVGDSALEPLLPQVWDNLDNFSDPDGPGNYAIDPGPYYVEKLGRMIEVIPHGGYSYYRFIDDAKLTRLAPNLINDCAKVETDTFEVNAIMVLPQDAPSVENGIPNLENNEGLPTGCCQAAPREEPAEV